MKTLGLLLAFFASSSFGFLRARECRSRNTDLAAIIKLLHRMKNEVSSNLTVQSMIYKSFADEALEKNGFLTSLRRESESNTPQPFLKAMAESEIFDGDGELLNILKDFAENFGTMSRDEEILRCERALSELDTIYKKRRDESERQAKLYRSLGMSIGVGIVLMLW